MEGFLKKKLLIRSFLFVSLIWTLGCIAMTWLWIFILLFVSRWAFSLFIHQTTLSMQGWAGIPVPGHSSCEMLGLDFLCPSCSQILGMNLFIHFPFPNFWEWICAIHFWFPNVGIIFFCVLPVFKFWEWILLFLFRSQTSGMELSKRVPNSSKTFPLTPQSGRSFGLRYFAKQSVVGKSRVFYPI